MNFKFNSIGSIGTVPQVMELSFNQFRELFPSTVRRPLPRPELLLRDSGREVFLAASGHGVRLTVYRDGVTLYREPGGATAIFVQDCGKIAFRYVTETEYLDEAVLGGLLWYYPIILLGSHQVAHNQDSRASEYEVFRFDDETDGWPTVPHTPDFVSEAFRLDDERVRKELLLTSLSIAQEKLTPRQKEMIALKYGVQMTQTEIAALLGVTDSTVSITIRRALNALEKRMKV